MNSTLAENKNQAKIVAKFYTINFENNLQRGKEMLKATKKNTSLCGNKEKEMLYGHTIKLSLNKHQSQL